jgi:hypothetical protein
LDSAAALVIRGEGKQPFTGRRQFCIGYRPVFSATDQLSKLKNLEQETLLPERAE